MPEWIYTLTADGSHDAKTGATGVGIVIQQRVGDKGRGAIIEQVAEFHACQRGRSCERLAILRALEIATERGYSRLIIRSDYNWLRRRLREAMRRRTVTDLSDADREIIDCAIGLEWMDFRYVPRRKNQIAHQLANRARLEARSSHSLSAVRAATRESCIPGRCGCNFYRPRREEESVTVKPVPPALGRFERQ